MKTYLAKWPNGDISIVTASNQTELFWTLDSEGDPAAPKIYEIPTKSFSHISTSVKTFKNGKTDIKIDSNEYKLKRFKWNDGITEKAFRELVPEASKERIQEIAKVIGVGMI